MSKAAYVYILANKKNGTLYTGVTSDLTRRLYTHKHHVQEGFTNQYDVTRLVWFIQGEDITAAIALEKKIKNRSRQWKIQLIEENNPSWDDLAADWGVGPQAVPHCAVHTVNTSTTRSEAQCSQDMPDD